MTWPDQLSFLLAILGCAYSKGEETWPAKAVHAQQAKGAARWHALIAPATILLHTSILLLHVSLPCLMPTRPHTCCAC